MNIALILAKGESRRVHKKNMMEFCGLPLFIWSVRQAQASKLIDRVVVSTDDDEIADLALKEKADVVRRENVLDSQTLEEAVVHFFQNYDIKKNYDTIICLQPTSPLRLPEDIDNALRQLKRTKVNSIFSCNIEDDLFLWDGRLSPVTFERRSRIKDFYVRENGSFYIFEVSQFIGSRYAGLVGFYPMHKWQSFEIDEPEDIEIVEYFMKKKILI